MITVQDIILPSGRGSMIALEPFEDGQPMRAPDGSLMICSQRYFSENDRDAAVARARDDMAHVWGIAE